MKYVTFEGLGKAHKRCVISWLWLLLLSLQESDEWAFFFLVQRNDIRKEISGLGAAWFLLEFQGLGTWMCVAAVVTKAVKGQSLYTSIQSFIQKPLGFSL